MKKMFFLSLIISFVFSQNAQSQTTPESCDCLLDTMGLQTFLNSTTLNESNPLAFEVPNSSSTFAVLHGVIGSTSPSVVQTFIDNYPTVTTLVFMQIPGSEDDVSNLEASQLLKNRGYTAYLPAVNAYSQDAFIASGGVDMFLSGTRRIIDVNGEVGVHSWSDGINQATDFPVGDPVHQQYIDYYISMGFSQTDAEAFYYFTINAAPANGIHNMLDNELEQYKLRTCKYSATPNYTTSLNGNLIEADLLGASYQWLDCNNGNTPINGATNQSFTVSTTGDYAVQITESNCTGISNCQTVTVTSTFEIASKLIRIYPNPTTVNTFLIDLQDVDSKTVIHISDVTGKIVEILESEGNDVVQPNKFYQKGTYLVSIHLNDSVIIRKLIVQ